MGARLPNIFIDADACPVKEDTYRIAKRYQLKTFVVSCVPIFVPPQDSIELVVTGKGFDAVDDWIESQAGAGDIVLTNDILLAARCVKKESRVINSRGQILDEDNIGEVLATRELMAELRERGALDLGPKKLGKHQQSSFLSNLDELINSVRKHGK